jgi:hypothetical protein
MTSRLGRLLPEHLWKFPAKGSSKKGKNTSTHEVNLMDINPLAEEAINDIVLSGDECIVLDCTLSDYEEEGKSCERLLGDESKDCVLDSSNTFTTLLAAKAKIAQNKKRQNHR